MDVNYLLHRQQVSMIRAANASSVESKTAHESLARAYRERINNYRQENCERAPAH
jgi:hypothetical protein